MSFFILFFSLLKNNFFFIWENVSFAVWVEFMHYIYFRLAFIEAPEVQLYIERVLNNSIHSL